MKDCVTNLQNETYNLLKDYAEEYWADDTYVLEFDDTTPASVLHKLLKLTDTYPQDTVVMFDNTITFMSLGGHITDSIQLKVNITRRNWKARARRYAKKMNIRGLNTDEYLTTAYVLSLLTGGCIGESYVRWSPTVITDCMPCAI